MRLLRWIFAFLLVMLVIFMTRVQAQARDCGNGLPCGPVPWDLPGLPHLIPPTLIPDTSVSVPGPTSAPAPTSVPSNLINLDTSGLNNQVATLNAVIAATPVSVSNLDGSFTNPDMQATRQAEMGQNSGTFFGYVRGLADSNFGVMTPVFFFVLFSFVLTFFTKISSIFLPILVAVFGFVRKIVQLVLEFIPL